VLSGRGLCDELITRPEEYYRLWCVVVCDLETSRMRRSWPALSRSATENKNVQIRTRFLWYSYCDWKLSTTNTRNSKADVQPARWFSQFQYDKTAERKWPTNWTR
jgi:hypothetical protein